MTPIGDLDPVFSLTSGSASMFCAAPWGAAGGSAMTRAQAESLNCTLGSGRIRCSQVG